MEQINKIILVSIAFSMLSSFSYQENKETYAITVDVDDLRNSIGLVQFTLYNKDGTIPDEHFKKYYKQLKTKIIDNAATTTFNNLPKGEYAINILHDENEDGVIDKGWILPVEGIGFSNLKSINPLNRPSFKKAKFKLDNNTTIKVKIIYL